MPGQPDSEPGSLGARAPGVGVRLGGGPFRILKAEPWNAKRAFQGDSDSDFSAVFSVMIPNKNKVW